MTNQNHVFNQNRHKTTDLVQENGSFLPQTGNILPTSELENVALDAPFLLVPFWFYDLGLTQLEERVLARVLSFYVSGKNDTTGNKPWCMCMSSYKLARQLRSSQYRVDRALKHLEQLGYITAERPWQKDGKERPDRRPVKYTFNVRTCVYAALEAGYDFGMTLDNGSDYKPWLRDDYHDHKTAGKE